MTNLGLVQNQKEAQLKHQEEKHNLRVATIVFFGLFLGFNVVLACYALINLF